MKQGVYAFFNWFFAVSFSVIGLINCFFGNDPEFGIFILLLSLLFYPPIRYVFQKKTGWAFPILLLLGLGVFIFWVSLGVGELLTKVQFILGNL